MEHFRKKVVVGAAWMVGMRFTVNSLGMISSIILARLLTPEDFGVVGLSGSAYTFLRVIGQFGFDQALIQMKQPLDEHYNTAWTANILVGLTIAVMMFVVAKPAAIFFHDPRIQQVSYVFASFALANSFTNVGIVNFRKQLAFRGDYLYFVLPKIAMLVAAITAAYLLRNYWALVIGMFASQVTALTFSYIAHPYRPRFALSKFSELFNFSRWILLNNLQNYMVRNGVEIILGRLRDAHSVGIFNMARQIAVMPTSELIEPLNRALFPSFSAIADDARRLQKILENVLGVILLVALPAASGILVLSERIVGLLLGDHWLPVAPILGILGFAGVINAIKEQFNPIMMARGKPKVLSQVLFVYVLIVFGGTLFVVSRYGGMGIAYVSLAGAILTFPLMLVAVKKEIGFPVSGLTKAVWRPLLASLIMVVIVERANVLLPLHMPMSNALTLFTLVGLGAAAYVASIAALWGIARKPEGAERELISFLGARFRKLRGVLA